MGYRINRADQSLIVVSKKVKATLDFYADQRMLSKVEATYRLIALGLRREALTKNL